MGAAIRRLRWAVPYLFLLPGGLWLLVFFVVPMAVMASISLQTGSLGTGYALTWEQVSDAADDGRAANGEVSTQGCAG